VTPQSTQEATVLVVVVVVPVELAKTHRLTLSVALVELE
jgi:hypothetical protein